MGYSNDLRVRVIQVVESGAAARAGVIVIAFTAEMIIDVPKKVAALFLGRPMFSPELEANQ